MIAHGVPIYVALEPVDMRLGIERLPDETTKAGTTAEWGLR